MRVEEARKLTAAAQTKSNLSAVEKVKEQLPFHLEGIKANAERGEDHYLFDVRRVLYRDLHATSDNSPNYELKRVEAEFTNQLTALGYTVKLDGERYYVLVVSWPEPAGGR